MTSAPGEEREVLAVAWAKRLWIYATVILVIAIINIGLTAWIINELGMNASDGIEAFQVDGENMVVRGQLTAMGGISASQISTFGGSTTIGSGSSGSITLASADGTVLQGLNTTVSLSANTGAFKVTVPSGSVIEATGNQIAFGTTGSGFAARVNGDLRVTGRITTSEISSDVDATISSNKYITVEGGQGAAVIANSTTVQGLSKVTVSVTSGPLTVSLAAPYILNSNVASQAGIVTRRLCLCQHQTTFEWIAYTVPSTAASCDHVSQSQIDAICGTA